MKKILIVEDSKLVHRMYDLMLKRHQLVHCYDGREGLAKLAEHPDANLILLDINMPHMNGLEFLRELRQDAAFATIPVVIVSTEGKDEDTQRALEAGATTYLTKPFQAEDLNQVVGTLLEGVG